MMQMAFYCRKKKSKRAEKSIPPPPSPPSLYNQHSTSSSSSVPPDNITMASPENPNPNPNPKPNMSSNDEDQDQNLQPQSKISETLDTQNPQNPQIEDQQQQQRIEDTEQEEEEEEPEQTGMVSSPSAVVPSQPISDTHVTITIPDQNPVLESPPLTTPTNRRRGTKRKKPMQSKKRHAITKKLELLAKTFKPIPFVPNKALDFSTHEKILKRLGLWDFVHVELDRNIRTELVAQLIASFNPQGRCSYINDVRISVSRADLARALKLPGKKDRNSVVEVVSEESIAYVEDLVSNWVLLHEDTWILPNEVLNWTRVIKEGHPEKVDWASLMWFMVEKEVAQGPRLGQCYYASHLQCLIKSQRMVLFSEEPIVDLTVKEEEEDEDAGEVKVSEDGEDAKVKVSEDGEDVKVKVSEGGEVAKVNEDGGPVKKSEDCSDVKMGEDHSDVKMGEDHSDVKTSEDHSDVKMAEDGDDVKTVEEGDDVKTVEEGDDVKTVEEGDDVNTVEEGDDVKTVEEGDDVKTVEEGGDVKMGEDGSDVKLGEDCNDVKMGIGGSYVVHELEEPNIELSLGQDRFEKEQLVQGDVMDFEECNEQEPGQWLLNGQNNVGEHFLQRCNQDRDLVCDEEERQEEQEDPVYEQEQQQGFSLLPKSSSIEAISSANLIQEIEASQVPYSPPMQHRNHSLLEQFVSRAEANPDAGGPSIFGNVSKREVDHEHEISRQPLNGNPKGLRSAEPWEQKSSDFDLCMENVQHWMGKAKLVYQAKEHTCTDLNVNQELLMNELQQRDNMIEQLQKVRFEEQQKRQMDIYRLERELFSMDKLLQGYRKALKETRRQFSEYRASCPLPEEALYKDVPGSGGLVLTATELERQRLKQEEEERIIRIEMEFKIKEFEADWTDQFELHLNKADMLNSKLLDADKEVKLLKEICSERKRSLAIDPPSDE